MKGEQSMLTQNNILSSSVRTIAEWEQGATIVVGWPSRADTWRDAGVPAQDKMLAFVFKILKHTTESVVIVVNRNDEVASARLQTKLEILLPSHCRHRVSSLEIPTNDCWMRDTGCIWVRTIAEQQQTPVIKGACFQFNAWGGADGGCYQHYDYDQLVAGRLCERFRFASIDIDLILEGGSVTFDDNGTVITTEECLLSPNRNPTLSKQQIEKVLQRTLGTRIVIWLPFGLENDSDTDGHVDNIAMFIQRGHVLLAWTDDGENAKRCTAAYEILQEVHDSDGNTLQVHKVCIPPKIMRSSKEIDGICEGDGKPRPLGEALCLSYVNILQTNEAVFVPSFGFEESDKLACDQIQHAINSCSQAGLSVVPVEAREFVLAGGGPHCLTLRVPSHQE